MKKARKFRLQEEYEKLLLLEARVARTTNGASRIEIEPVDVAPDCPPEKYIVTYRCRGIVGIGEDKQPIYGDTHQVEISLSQDFLDNGPALSALTPIWHPQIDHRLPRHIDYNSQNFMTPVRSIYDLVLEIGKIIQYKNYHARWEPPYPFDIQAADWVVDFAEPNGILGQNKPVDNCSLLAEMDGI